jgi:hypothetical protein
LNFSVSARIAMPLLNEQYLRWDLSCIACHWRICVEALVPFTGTTPVPLRPGNLVSGFWEDYVCPVDFQTARRAVRIKAATADLEAAHFLYFSGQITADPIPHCPVCAKTMSGGQVLQRLPFLIALYLETQQWLHQKLALLQQMVLSEQRAVATGNQSADASLQLVKAEFQVTARFYQALCQEFDLRAAPIPVETFPASLVTWVDVLTSAIAATESRLAQLEKRQQVEAQKAPGRCPRCHQQCVYLRIAL